MNVELAPERILVLRDRFSMEHAEGTAWPKRIEAFGTLAKMAGLLNRPKDDDFEVVYRERRLQPFWRFSCQALYAYERRRDYSIHVAADVRTVRIAGADQAVVGGAFTLTGVEVCREEISRDFLFDGLTRTQHPELAACLVFDADIVDEAHLAEQAGAGTVVVPPQVTDCPDQRYATRCARPQRMAAAGDGPLGRCHHIRLGDLRA